MPEWSGQKGKEVTMSLSIGNTSNSLQGMSMPTATESGTTDQGASTSFNSAVKHARHDHSPADKSWSGHCSTKRRRDHGVRCEKPVTDCGDKGDSKTEMKELLAVLKELVTSIGKMLEANTPQTDAAAIEPAPEEPVLMDPPAEGTEVEPEVLDPAGVDAADQMTFDPSMMDESIESDPTITPLFGSTQPEAATEVPGDNSAQMQQILMSLQGVVSQLSAMLANSGDGSATGV